MNWSQSREEYRQRLVNKYDASEATRYESYLGSLAREDEQAYLADMEMACSFRCGQKVLDVGAGTGALTKILTQVAGLQLTAMEPSLPMLELLRAKPELAEVKTVHSGCDRSADRSIFPESSFDIIVSRQVVNSLFDPLVAFENWLHWLKPRGRVLVIDGVYGRDGWTGVWEEEVDVIPLSACQSLATVAYLMESVGFEVDSVGWMPSTNKLPATRTKRYLVAATKP